MSNLSSLLNPAPNAAETAHPKGQQPAPLKLDGQDHRSRTDQLENGSAQSPVRHTVTSPGLDALATVASNTAPLMSPTQPHSSTAQASLESQAQSSARTGSGAGDLPVHRTADQFQQQQYSSGPYQNHDHGLDSDQHMSNYNEGPSETLAPLQQVSSRRIEDSSTIDNTLVSHSQLAGENKDASLYTSSLPQDQPATSQIGQSSSAIQSSLPADSAPRQAEQVQVKAELTETRDVEMKDASPLAINTSVRSLPQYDSRPGTPLKNVTTSSPTRSTQAEDSALPKTKAIAPPRKRPPPKKGIAAKPPAKKRKVENESGKASPRTGTPATSRASGTPAPKKGKQDSATPTRSSSVANPEDDDDDGESELFCICRKPDDHTVMIGCDGPCEDWFHTRCVNMTDEKVALISRWYCPNCAEKGHETEWKRMCRLEGCSKPAIVETRNKYCCSDHGKVFMERLVSSIQLRGSASSANKKRKRDNYTDHISNEGDDEEEQDDNRGGVLRPGELKALVDGVKDVAAFRRLGDGVLSPPETAATSPSRESGQKIAYNAEERNLLDEIAKKRASIEARKDMLNDRETLVHLVDGRRKIVLGQLKKDEKSLKDICGYDARLTWSDDEFNEWRNSEDGRDQLRNAVLRADPKFGMTDRADDAEEPEIGPGVCKKKRCGRHGSWFKTQQQDNAMVRQEIRQELRRLDEDEKGVKERAMIRSLEEGQDETIG